MKTTFDSQPVHSPFLSTLITRGFVHQCTDITALDTYLSHSSIIAYIGFDLTADSLHAGHLIPIMMLRWLQRSGHKPIILLGGGTTRIGDPSFRDTSRPLLDNDQIAHNMAGIKRSFEQYLTFGSGATDAVMVNNADWLDNLNYIDFLRDFGQHFSVNRMLSFDSVRQRLEREQSLSLLEFNYMVIQAYDFLELARTYNCTLQMGASDQWGNIINGVELGRRIAGHQLFGLTSPLLISSSGKKMGKSASGAVWLNAERLAPYEFWQFWRNTDDSDVGRYLRLFTELPLDDIEHLEGLTGTMLNKAKVILADEVTSLCHGLDAARHAKDMAIHFFEQGTFTEGFPSISLELRQIEQGLLLIDLLLLAEFVNSRSAARRLIQGGGIRINNMLIEDQNFIITPENIDNGLIKVSVGRKNHKLIRLM